MDCKTGRRNRPGFRLTLNGSRATPARYLLWSPQGIDCRRPAAVTTNTVHQLTSRLFVAQASGWQANKRSGPLLWSADCKLNRRQ